MLTVYVAAGNSITSNSELQNMIYLEMPYHIFNVVSYIVFMQL